MPVKLRVVNSKNPNATFQVLKTPYVIGRHKDCDIRINSPQVSVRHSAIVLRDGKPFARDLDSTNGTRVNGVPVHSGDDRELRDGDKLWVGPVLIEIAYEVSVDILGADDSCDYSDTQMYVPALPRPAPKSGGEPPKTERPPKPT